MRAQLGPVVTFIALRLLTVTAVDVPAECKTPCDASQALIDACQPATAECICTQPYEQGLFDCGSCLGAGNATDYARQQQELDGMRRWNGVSMNVG
ncbi:hypothetical protein EXIGLDRAFT_404255 [Exidia glandulosa HHB12029]|uniref:Extracellular membrane protein CFEM domain-containing protein n=1 Tax=Exidia glandulosa HHB12029 TaxID=1314781 RepID=A0A165KS85_EXIGL|nr:hypothetical protein EXIGLDRAFT_404255 [Exidia glandulosa HHB12029]